jgi:CheY-like chemotaxis protein
MKHVMLIEDNPADVFLMREALSSAEVECELTVIQDGQEALNRIRSWGSEPLPDLVLLDLNLPTVGGMEILKALRARTDLDVPVAVLTSSDAPGEKEWISRLGVRHYIVKPMRLKEFMKIGELIKEELHVAHA